MKLFGALLFAGYAMAQVQGFKVVTQQMLENPSPDDWLMFSRTYDAQRFSPLKEINQGNVSKLKVAWERSMAAGQTETVPIVHDGVMYIVNPGAVVQALDGATGKVLWETTLATSVQGFPTTFTVGGKQYLAVSTGLGGGSPRQVPGTILPDVHHPATGNAIYVFELPGK